ncbi:MAG: integrase arm-type DNA-binding domain-containing protein, partial [Proteobacteria bacterium]|nr:integrase arm-type DNA-binding domain-containing protein [Pseudomonadota bacterium]
MAGAINKLTVKGIDSIKHDGKDVKLFDGAGLYLHIQKSGKYWRLKYRFQEKEKTLALGVYPQVSLAEVREKREQSKKLIAQGIDPILDKKQKIRSYTINQENTFKALAIEWLEQVHNKKVCESHAERNYDRFEKYIFPKLGDFPITEITPLFLLKVLRELEQRGILETVQRVKSLCSQVFRYAIVTGRAERNPAEDLKGVLKTPEEKHHPAITNPDEIKLLLRAIDGYAGQSTTRAALRLAPYLFVRPGELRQMKWKDIDLDSAIWNYAPSKNGLPFKFPLSRQVVEILLEQYNISHNSEYVFPSPASRLRPM